MQAMPLPCKILKNYASSVVVDVVAFGTIAKDVQSRNPHSIGESIDLEWVNLTYSDVFTLETAFLASKGSGRFSYLNGIYTLEGNYTIKVTKNKPYVQATFTRVS